MCFAIDQHNFFSEYLSMPLPRKVIPWCLCIILSLGGCARMVNVSFKCPAVASGESVWSVTITPVSKTHLRLDGDLYGVVEVSDSTFCQKHARPSHPWLITYAVEVRSAPDPNTGDDSLSHQIMFSNITEGNDARNFGYVGAANTCEDAWELARYTFAQMVAVEIGSWIKGEIVAPPLMKHPIVLYDD